jgi:hypothetical protein
MKRKRFTRIYQPGLDDRVSPNVIQGSAIAPGSRVRIARELHPPMLPRVFVFVEDSNGNVQSVWKPAVMRQREAGKPFRA